MAIRTQRRELVETRDLMVGNALEDIGQPCLRINAIQLCRFDQRIGDGGGSPASLRSGEEPVFPADGYRTHGSFGGVVIGHADIGVSISRPVFPSVVVVRVSGIGASECEEAGRPNRQ